MAVLILALAGGLACDGGDPAEPRIDEASTPVRVDAPRPNVVLISVDTLRADHLGCYGYARDTSPAIDALAAQGVRFTRAFSQASWTLPSHMSLMTSRLPSEHGVVDDGLSLSPSVGTLAEVMRAEGYATAAFVSWIYTGETFGFARGFDRFVDLVDRAYVRAPSGGGAPRAAEVVAAALSWLFEPPARPWFLFVHLFDPHMDYSPPPPFDRRFVEDGTGPVDGSYAQMRPYIKYYHEGPERRIEPATIRYAESLYDGEIGYVDQQIAVLASALDGRACEPGCVIILLSDHGEEFGEHGSMEGHGWTVYDEVLRVPLIVRLPDGRAAGTSVSTQVALIDVAPTILELAGIEVPAGFRGRSMLPLIGGAEGDAAAGTAEGRLIYSETDRFDRRRVAVRDERYKLIHTTRTGRAFGGRPIVEGYELYDLLEDPGEQNDLHGRAPSVSARLADALSRFEAGAGRASAAAVPTELPAEDRARLRSLGYAE